MIYQLTQTGDQVQTILDQAPTTEQSLQDEITRSTGKDEQLETAIGNEKTRAEGVEGNLQTAINNEKTRAEGVEGNLQTAIGNEKTRAELIEGGLRTDVDGINAKIPSGATSENKLATQSFVNSSLATATADFKGTYNSLEALETAVHDANANDYAFVVSTDASGNTVYNRYKYVDGTGWVFEYALNNSSFTEAQWAAINSAITAALVAKLTGLPTATELTQQLNTIIGSVTDEKTRAEGAEGVLRGSIADNATAIGNEKTRAEGAEGNLQTLITNEEIRAKAAEVVLQQNIDAEALLRANGDNALQGEIDTINGKIPTAATSSNQLADKAFVNSSIATNTATFRGTYNSVEALQNVTADANDYAFVVAVDSAGNTVYNRYKYVDDTGWVFEYALNNSSFTSDQWAAINSGITAALTAKLDGLPDNDALTAMFAAITAVIPSAATSENKLVDYAQFVAGLATKQNTLIFDNVPTENSSNPVKSGGVYSAIATVTAAIVGLQSSKQDVLTFDNVPTTGSDNPVKSKGIKTYVDDAVAPKANQTALDAETTRATNAESGLSTRISTNASDIAALQAAYSGLTQSDVVVVATTDTWPVSNPQQNTIYRVVDRVNTPPQYYTDYMWNGTTMVQMAQYNNAIDDVPTAGSNNLVKSGGVFNTQYQYNISNKGVLNSIIKELYVSANVDLSDVKIVRFYAGYNSRVGLLLYDNSYNLIIGYDYAISSKPNPYSPLFTNGSTLYAVIDWDLLKSEYLFPQGYYDINGIELNVDVCSNIEFNPYISRAMLTVEDNLSYTDNAIKGSGIFRSLFGGVPYQYYISHYERVNSNANNIRYSFPRFGRVTATVSTTGDCQGFYFGFSETAEVFLPNKTYRFLALFKNEGFDASKLKGVLKIMSGGVVIVQTTASLKASGNYLLLDYSFSHTAAFSLEWFCIYQESSGTVTEGSKLTYLDFNYFVTDGTNTTDLDGVSFKRIKDVSRQDKDGLYDDNYENVIQVYPDDATPCQIANLIRSISDARIDNRYLLVIHNGTYQEIDIVTKDYVDIIGESYNGVVLNCDGDATYNAPSDYSFDSQYSNQPVNGIPTNMKHLIRHMSNSTVKNLTLQTSGGATKYISHQDGYHNVINSAVFENCLFLDGGSTQILGIGAEENQNYLFRNCQFVELKRTNLSQAKMNMHNWSNNVYPCSIVFENCQFSHVGWIMFTELGSGQSDRLEFINCVTDDNEKTFVLFDAEASNKVYGALVKAIGGNIEVVTAPNRSQAKYTNQSANIKVVSNIDSSVYGNAVSSAGALAANADNGFDFVVTADAGGELKTVNAGRNGYGLAVAGEYAAGDAVYVNNGKFTKTANGNIAGYVVVAQTLTGDGYILIKKK